MRSLEAKVIGDWPLNLSTLYGNCGLPLNCELFQNQELTRSLHIPGSSCRGWLSRLITLMAPLEGIKNIGFVEVEPDLNGICD